MQYTHDPHAREQHAQRGNLARSEEPRPGWPRMVEIFVWQPRELPRRPHKRHDRLGVEYKAVQAVAVARSSDPTDQILDLLRGKHAVYERPECAYPHDAYRGESFASVDTPVLLRPFAPP